MGKAGNKRRKDKNLPPIQNELGQPVLDMLGRKIDYEKDPVIALPLPNGNVVTIGHPPQLPFEEPKRPLLSLDPAPNTKVFAPQRRVTLMKDHELDFPDLVMEIMLVGPEWDQRGFAQLFSRATCRKAQSIDTADLVVFTGGEDVDPAYYGAKKHPMTCPNPERDSLEAEIYAECLHKGVPMLGVCRGAQFLHVMNGGKLYQHVDHHHGDHSIWDIRKQVWIDRVSSVHHQMVMDNEKGGMEIIATANKARNRWVDNTINHVGTQADIEAFFYRDTCCIGIQGHPEYAGYNQFAKWSLDLINELVIMNNDIDWIDKVRRIKPELLAEREGLLQLEKGK